MKNSHTLKYCLTAFMLSIGLLSGYAQKTFRTMVHDADIKSFKLSGSTLLSDPIIDVSDEEDYVFLSFDELSGSSTRFSYRVTHCDADWRQSALVQIEYLDGFQDIPIEDYEPSGPTIIDYWHYSLAFPNEETNFKVSGNYAVEIFRDDEPSKPVITACFSIVEPMVNISMEVTSRTLIDSNREHHQVGFVINHPRLSIAFPQNELKLYLTQNNRLDNAVINPQPHMIGNGRIEYNFNQELIFKAGNEFRRFEFLSINAPGGMNIESRSFHDPYTHVTLYPAAIRTNAGYQYDEDQNGRFFINTLDGREPNTEANYEIVHFFLPAADPFLDGSVYLYSEIFQYNLNEQSKVTYDFKLKSYVKSMLLKQGLYNYQYLFVPHGTNVAETRRIEGDKHETENEYRLMVYYRPMGQKYDRLIGVRTIQSNR